MQILVRESSFHSDDKYDLIYAVIQYVNELLGAYYKYDEIPVEALYVYNVDYYMQQIENGGVSQFVYNSRWNPMIVAFVENGLREIQAKNHLQLFAQISADVSSLGENLNEYFEGDYFEDQIDVRDFLDRHSERFIELQEKEDLLDLNHGYITRLENLKVLSEPEYEKQFRQIVENVPDKESRILEAEANEPEERKKIKQICRQAEQELKTFNAIDFQQYEGQKVAEWHISTSAGHHYVIFAGGKTLLFNGTTRKLVTEMDL